MSLCTRGSEVRKQLRSLFLCDSLTEDLLQMKRLFSE